MEQQFDTPTPPIPPSPRYSNQSIGVFLGGTILVLVLLGAAFSALRSGTSPTASPTSSQSSSQSQALNLAPYTLVYGSWSSTNSLIKAVDLTSGKEYNLASLPTTIKKVTTLDNNHLLFINQTDSQDHGKSIAVYSIQTKTTTPVMTAAPGFGIDDYVLSPNKQYIAVWEVATNPDTGAFFGGKSRVYTALLAHPGATNLLYDETATQPVHYPLAILNDGTTYLDTFLPNSGAGWAYGMSVSNFTGSQKQDLSNMQNGTYGTQPVLSPDGHYLVFAGYDGSKHPGTILINGFRQSVSDPDTLELLDTTNNQRITLPNVSNQSTYMNIHWDSPTSFVYYENDKSQVSASGLFEYSIPAQKATKLPVSNNTGASIVTADGPTLLVGSDKSTQPGVNNLGDKYATNFTKLYLSGVASSSLTPIPLPDAIPQYIALLPAQYFNNTSLTPVSQVSASGNNQLQLQTFVIKPSLAPVRQAQQSNPVPGTNPPAAPPTNTCATASSTNCYDAHGNYISSACDPSAGLNCTHLPSCGTLAANQCPGVTQGSTINPETGQQDLSIPPSSQPCVDQLASNGECVDSPLYLYGTPGTNVTVKIHTPVFNSSPVYTNSYSVTLGNDGEMLVNGKTYTKLSYDYLSALGKVSAPDYGTVTSQQNLKQTVHYYAQSLGLNRKETRDLEDFTNTIHSPYIFVSFYNENVSQEILPLSFSPKPESYNNIVFYFKAYHSDPHLRLRVPVFEKMRRAGLTGVEISEILR